MGMMAWHAQLGWVKGGFARMTIFFVLAGFLATRSYVGMRGRGVERPFTAFWTRRARRLLPITVLGVALAVAVTVWIGSDRAQQSLGGDTFSVLANVSNWRFMIDDRSYGALFENPSAFQHFWSLSVEEQWFLAIPAVLGVAAWVGRRHEAWSRHVVAGAAVALGLVPLLVSHTPDQAYYGTHVRGAEFLAGAWLALWLDHRGRVGWSATQRRVLSASGLASLGFLLAVMLLVDRTQPWLYQGGMGLFAIPAALVVAACVTGAPTLERVLGIAPLRWLGVAALSIYALHWPLFQLVDHQFPTLEFTAVVTIELAVAIAVGSAVHVWIERPLLPDSHHSRPGGRAITNRMVLSPVAAVMVVILLVAVLRDVPAPTYDFEAAQQEAIARSDRGAIGPAEGVAAASEGSGTEPQPGAARLGVFGGSSALVLGLAAGYWTETRDDIDVADGYARLGCGLLTDGARVSPLDPEGRAKVGTDDTSMLRPPVECLDWPSRWSDATRTNDVDVALVLLGTWDTADWFLDDDHVWRTIEDPVIEQATRARLIEAIDELTASGSHQVILASIPRIGPGDDGRARLVRGFPDDQDERTRQFNDLLRSVADERDDVGFVDFGDSMDALSPEESGRLLPDGVHATPDTAPEVWQSILGPLVAEAMLS